MRILPSHLLESRLEMRDVIVPEGYAPVWEDGRLNPRRGEQSIEGYKQSQSVLTLTVPRRSPSTRASSPRIREPRLASDEPVRTPSPQFIVGGSAGGVAKAPIAPKRVDPSQIFVQVKQIRDPDQAQALAQKMARTGVPTRMGTKIRGGTSVRLVLAGPFNTRAEAQRAVQTARRAGFSDAVIMN